MKEKHNPSGILGCEVNYCTAKHCNEVRMSFCALRQAYNERVCDLRKLRDAAKSKSLRDELNAILRGMGADAEQ
ncbi:MAG: hypothetical protein PHC50_04455 [Candidatus Cloacimonetes bacterium]|nr:hypothetical protein [Candidatus Cloacimonadota bacterium]